jgi:hypothetical protein
LQNEFTAANNALEAETAGTDAYNTANAAVDAAEKKLNRAISELE